MLMKNKLKVKTNAMRILEKEKIPFSQLFYECDGFTDGIQVADLLGLTHEKVFKTLVTKGSDGEHYVFVIPIARELDLKKCAHSVNVKAVEMAHVKDLFGLTGYIRGACTCIGMKKAFITRVDESARNFATIYVSGGKIGVQLRLSPDDLLKLAYKAVYADLVKS